MAFLMFEHPEFLFLFLAIPLIITAHYFLFRFTKRKGMVFANFETLERVTGKKLMTKNATILILRILAFSCIILALTTPVALYQAASVPSDYVIAIDASASMTTDDLTPTRFEAAQYAATGFLDTLPRGAKVGYILFSGTVLVESLVTEDLDAVRQDIIQSDVQRASGTDIGGAIITGTNLLLGSDKGRVIVLLTDGSSTAGAAKDDPVAAALMYAQQHQVVVHAVGVGNESSRPTGYLPRIYNISAVYDEDMVTYIANQTGGLALSAANNDQLAAAWAQIAQRGESTVHEYPLTLILLLLALGLLFLEWGLENTRFRFIP